MYIRVTFCLFLLIGSAHALVHDDLPNVTYEVLQMQKLRSDYQDLADNSTLLKEVPPHVLQYAKHMRVAIEDLPIEALPPVVQLEIAEMLEVLDELDKLTANSTVARKVMPMWYYNFYETCTHVSEEYVHDMCVAITDLPMKDCREAIEISKKCTKKKGYKAMYKLCENDERVYGEFMHCAMV